MKKIYVKPCATMVKMMGYNVLMAGSGGPHTNGSIQGEQQGDFCIDISYGGWSKNDEGEKDNQDRLWVD